MKNEPTQYHSPTPNAPAAARHQFEHVTPTVIHDPEQEMTLLARWLHRAMKNPAKFWGWIGAAVAALLALVIAANLFGSGSGRASNVWTKLDESKSADDQIELAKANPSSPAAPWALLSAASQLYLSGVADLPNNADTALQSLKKAVDVYDQIAKEQPKDSPVAPAAAFGKARALEARNELPKAVDQYKLVAETWPDSAEAAEAKRLAAELQKPEAAAFYKDLYAYKPAKVTLPPIGGDGNLDFPAVVPSPPTDAPADGSLLIPPPPSSAAPAEEPKAEEPKVEEPKAEEPKTDEPKAEPAQPDQPKAEPAAPPAEPKADEPKAEPAAQPAEAEAPKS